MRRFTFLLASFGSVFARGPLFLFFAIGLALGIFSPAVHAQIAWSTTAATGSMATGTNWVGNVAPTTGNSISFSSSTTTSVLNDNASLSLAGITFNGTSIFTISGNAITLTSGSISQNDTPNTDTIATDLVISAASVSISTPNSASLVISGGISGNHITKTGGGTLVLSGANTYTSGTQINNGLVQLSGSGTLGSTSAVLNMNGGNLDLNGTSQTVGNLSGNSGASNIYNNATGTSSTFTIGNGFSGSVTLSGVISDHTSGTGTVAVIKTGTSTIGLSGSNTFTGGTTISNGALTLNSASALSGATGTLTVSGGVLGSTVSATTIGSDLTLSSGFIDLNGSGAGSLTLASGKTFSMSGGTITFVLGTSFDQIISFGSGTLSLTGGTFNLTTGGLGFNYATSYQIFSGFDSASFGAITLSGYDTADYSAAVSNAGVLSFTAIPEPSTYAALVAALSLGFTIWRRRKAACADEALA